MQLGQKAGLKSSKPMRDVFGDALLAVATENPKVVVLDGDLGNSTKADKVRQRFPDRFFNIGIAESNLVGIGAGMAGAGFIPLDHKFLVIFCYATPMTRSGYLLRCRILTPRSLAATVA